MPLFLKYLNVADAKVFAPLTLQYCYEILSLALAGSYVDSSFHLWTEVIFALCKHLILWNDLQEENLKFFSA